MESKAEIFGAGVKIPLNDDEVSFLKSQLAPQTKPEGIEHGAKAGLPNAAAPPKPGFTRVRNVNAVYGLRYKNTFQAEEWDLALPPSNKARYLVPFQWSGVNTTPLDRSTSTIDEVKGPRAFFRKAFKAFKDFMHLVMEAVGVWKEFAALVLQDGSPTSMQQAHQPQDALRNAADSVEQTEAGHNPRTPRESLLAGKASALFLGKKLPPEECGMVIIEVTRSGHHKQLVDSLDREIREDLNKTDDRHNHGWKLEPDIAYLQFHWASNANSLPNDESNPNDGDCYGSFTIWEASE
jgi:hypothetical protein